MDFELLNSDCVTALKAVPANSIDSCVTDPPSGISLHGLEWDTYEGDRKSARTAFIAFIRQVFEGVFRVLKPGAYGVVWALPRTSGWTACGLEDAGFEIRDVLTHHFSTGMVKQKNTLRPASEHWILIRKPLEGTVEQNLKTHGVGELQVEASRVENTPGIRGRWPSNVLFSHSPECELAGTQRIQGQKTVARPPDKASLAGWGHKRQGGLVQHASDEDGMETLPKWNCAPGCAVALLESQEMHASRFFPQLTAEDFRYQAKVTQEEKHAGTHSLFWKRTAEGYSPISFETWAELQKTAAKSPPGAQPDAGLQGTLLEPAELHAGDSQGLCAQGNIHPTPKSVALMTWLVRSVTPEGGKVLDCFMGSGTTGMACAELNRGFLGIEREPTYFSIAKARVEYARTRAALRKKVPVPQQLALAPVPEVPPTTPVPPGLSLSAERFAKLVKKGSKRRS